MLQKAELQREVEAALGAPGSTDVLLNAKREHGLQFLIDARPDQSLADVATVFQDWSARFEVEPLFPSPPFEAPAPGQGPAWGDTLFVATIPDVAFDDVTPLPWDMAHALRTEGGFARVIPETPIVRPEPPPEPESTSAVPLGWEHKAMRIAEAWAEIERRGRAPGINVRIGHPDTGWFPHEVWENGNLRTDLGRSFMPNEPNSRGQEPARGRSSSPGTALRRRASSFRHGLAGSPAWRLMPRPFRSGVSAPSSCIPFNPTS